MTGLAGTARDGQIQGKHFDFENEGMASMMKIGVSRFVNVRTGNRRGVFKTDDGRTDATLMAEMTRESQKGDECGPIWPPTERGTR